MDGPRAPELADFRGARHVDLSRWPLIGRDDELALATAALANSGCVVLTGAAGVGKTRLAREVVVRAATDSDRTEWVTATQSAATVPLGSVAHLVPDSAIGRGRDATLRGIVSTLRRDDGKRLLVGVDDAYLLDDASAALVQLLVAGGTASAVVTLRSGERAPDSIASLWKDGPAPLIALQALARAEVETVVTTVLDDAVDGATLHFLWESSRGNALFLRELVQHGVESGVLRHEQGMWRWHGPLEPGERLHQLVAMRMGTLNDAERDALVLLAMGQPLSVDCLRQLGISELVAQLERRGLVASQRRDGVVATLAHPLFGEILREQMPQTRRDEVQLQLANAVEATCDGSAAEQFRIALWRVDAGDRSRPEQLRAAARRALQLWEPVVAERLARATLEAGPEIEAAYILGAALSDQGRSEEALDALRVARTLPGSDRVRASVATDEAGVLSHQLGRWSDAEDVLRETLELVSDRDARAIIEGGRAAILVSGGHGTAPGELTDAVPTAVLAAVIEHAAAGRLDFAIRLARERLATAPEWTDEFPMVEHFFQLAQTWAYVLSGQLEDAQTCADAGYAAALEEHAEFPRVTWSLVRGLIFVTRGQPHTATRALQEAAAGFATAERGFLRATHGYLAMATALAGDVTASEQHVRAAHVAPPGFEAVFAVDTARARAWLLAAEGEVSAAVDEAQRVGADAADRNAWGLEAHALHDAARFGRAVDVVDRLEALREIVDGALVETEAAHARALVDDDGPGLDAVSRAFSSLSLDLFAAEASAAAARAYRRAGKRASAFAALERARELGARCESAQTPALNWADQPEELTAREREVADLAASQLASREIADRLGITRRTVDNFLGRVYAKLGVSGRQELAEVLRTARDF